MERFRSPDFTAVSVLSSFPRCFLLALLLLVTAPAALTGCDSGSSAEETAEDRGDGDGGGVTGNIAGSWSQIDPGLLGAWELAMEKDGDLYVGGVLTQVGDAGVKYAARWDGSEWDSLGGGFHGYTSDLGVHDLILDREDNLYAVASLAGGVMKWDGSEWTWTFAPSLFTFVTYTITADADGNIYAGGSGNNNSVRKWNGSEWTALGEELGKGVDVLASGSEGKLYAGFAEDRESGRVAVWDGSNWQPLGEGLNGVVEHLVVDSEGNLFAAGSFSESEGGTALQQIARWNGTAWSPLGDMNSSGRDIGAMILDEDDNLLVSRGAATMVWDGAAWSTLSGTDGPDTPTTALATDRAGNVFVAPGRQQRGEDGVVRYRISVWTPDD